MQVNPKGKWLGVDRVYRGGGWDNYGRKNRAVYRGRDPSTSAFTDMGFRIVLGVVHARKS